MIECALVFDKSGRTLTFHLPPGRSSVYIPDSGDLWRFLWDHKDTVGGVAHTHPWEGEANPSFEDVTTFSAMERGLGVRLVWVVATFTDVGYFAWDGVGYSRLSEPEIEVADIEELREKSR